MKGYAPNFKTESQTETASKVTKSFIELGTIYKCEENCNCTNGCLKNKNNE